MAKNTTDKPEVEFNSDLNFAMMALASYNPDVPSNSPKPDLVKMTADVDHQFTLGKARQGLATQYNAMIVLALIKSNVLKVNAKTGVDQYSGKAASIFKRLTTVPGITLVPMGEKADNLITKINSYLRPMIFNGHDLSKVTKDDKAKPGVLKFLHEIKSRRNNARPSIELGLLLYALGYQPTDYSEHGWEIQRQHLVPLERNSKGQLINYQFPMLTGQDGKNTNTATKRITLHPRDDGYRFVTVHVGDDGEMKMFRANYKQLLSAWRSDGTAENARETLSWAKVRDFVSSAINKPIKPDDYDAMATMLNMLQIQADKHADFADRVASTRKRMDEAMAKHAKDEAIEAERQRAAAVASGDEVIANGRAKLAAKTAAAEAKAKAEASRVESVEDRKSKASAA